MDFLGSMDNPAPLHGKPAGIDTKIVGNFAVIGYVEDGEIGEFANLEGTDLFFAAESVSGVDGGGGDGFGGRHAELIAGQGEDHGHAKGGAGTWIVVGGQSDDGAGRDEFAGRGVFLQAEMKITAREERGDGAGFGQSGNIRGVDLLEMIATDSAELDGKLGGTGTRELLGMETRREAVLLSDGEDFFGLPAGEGTAIAEYVAKFGELGGGDFGDERFGEESDVLGDTRRCAAVVFRDDMSAEEGGDDVERLGSSEFLVQAKDFEFARDVEAVAAFSFECGGAVSGEPLECQEGAGFEGVGSSGAKFFDGIENAAAFASNFFVGGAANFEFVFFGAASGVDEVGVGVDEAGKDDATGEVEFLGGGRFRQRFDFGAGSDGGDEAVAEEKCTVFDEAEIGQGGAAARAAAAEREQLRDAGDEEGVVQGPDSVT